MPVKRINTIADVELFLASPAYQRLRYLIDHYSQSVVGLTVPAKPDSELASSIVEDLGTFSQLIDTTPPVAMTQRFGNPSYRDWLLKLRQTELKTAPPEDLFHYLYESFGSNQRIDYGTGHELNFIAYVGGVSSHRQTQMSGGDILVVFKTYADLCRKMITRYNLEPAGSHGVWGLDDHFHMPYILGASQLAANGPQDPPFPKDVLDPRAIAEYKSSNLYFGAIDFINSVKRGAFFEHSPILYDVSGVHSWAKIRSGMIKMYIAEVLGRFPVVQHFYFGETYPFEQSD